MYALILSWNKQHDYEMIKIYVFIYFQFFIFLFVIFALLLAVGIWAVVEKDSVSGRTWFKVPPPFRKHVTCCYWWLLKTVCIFLCVCVCVCMSVFVYVCFAGFALSCLVFKLSGLHSVIFVKLLTAISLQQSPYILHSITICHTLMQHYKNNDGNSNNNNMTSITVV